MRAEVGLQRRAAAAVLETRAPALEQLDIGVAEAVDRLLGVTDREQVVAGDRLDQLELDPVGVLELVDHDPLEALGVLAAEVLAAAQQLPGEQLEVLEVDPRKGTLVLGVVPAEADQQPIHEVADGKRGPMSAGLTMGVQCLGVGDTAVAAEGGAVAGQLEAVELGRPGLGPSEHRLAALQAPERILNLGPWRGNRGQLADQDPRRRRESLGRLGPRCGRRRRQVRVQLTARAQLGVNGADRRAQRGRPEVGDQLDGALTGPRKLEQGILKGGVGQRLGLV